MVFIDSLLNGTALPLLLFCSGIYFSFRLGFFHLIHPVRIIRSYFVKSKEREGISPFKAVTLALAGTLGVGNIAGVSTAIAAGGPGAVFWMTASSLAAMVLKYAEVVLGVYYRKKSPRGFAGGAAYYILRGLGKRHLAVFFSVLFLVSSFAMGNIIQTKAVCDSFTEILGTNVFLTAGLIVIPVLLTVKGGIGKTVSFTAALIPFLCALYIGISSFIIIKEAENIPRVLSLIFRSAFAVKPLCGGVGGYTFSKALRYGAARGIASNEAGCGTAPTAHAGADTDSPVRQGFWGLFEVFADTAVLCTLTALVILLAFGGDIRYDGMTLALKAFEKYLGPAAAFVIAFSVFFFAVSTVICWYHYGAQALSFITKGRYENAYFASYLLMIFVSPLIPSIPAWEISDLTFALMTGVNIYALIRLRRVVSIQTKAFFKEKRV